MVLEYKVEKEHLLAYNMYSVQRMNPKGSKKFLKYVLPSILIALGLFLTVASFVVKDSMFWLGVFYLVLGLFLVFLKPLLVKTRVSKAVDKLSSDSYGKEVALQIEDERIVSKDYLGECRYRFTAIKNIFYSKNYVFIVLRNSASFILPKDQLNEFEVNNFIEKILEKVDIPVTQDLKWKL